MSKRFPPPPQKQNYFERLDHSKIRRDINLKYQRWTIYISFIALVVVIIFSTVQVNQTKKHFNKQYELDSIRFVEMQKQFDKSMELSFEALETARVSIYYEDSINLTILKKLLIFEFEKVLFCISTHKNTLSKVSKMNDKRSKWMAKKENITLDEFKRGFRGISLRGFTAFVRIEAIESIDNKFIYRAFEKDVYLADEIIENLNYISNLYQEINNFTDNDNAKMAYFYKNAAPHEIYVYMNNLEGNLTEIIEKIKKY